MEIHKLDLYINMIAINFLYISLSQNLDLMYTFLIHYLFLKLMNTDPNLPFFIHKKFLCIFIYFNQKNNQLTFIVMMYFKSKKTI